MNLKKIAIAKIVNIYGVKGQVKCIHYCDDVTELENYDVFYTKDQKELHVESIGFVKDMAAIKFCEISDADSGLLYKNTVLYIEKRQLKKLPDGVYYIDDLIGLDVIRNDNQKTLGKIIDVLKTGANDVYVVKDPEDKQILIPVIPEVIDEVNIDNGYVRITLLKGLIDDED